MCWLKGEGDTEMEELEGGTESNHKTVVPRVQDITPFLLLPVLLTLSSLLHPPPSPPSPLILLPSKHGHRYC